MAEFTHIQLKAMRESLKIRKWQLASELGVSEDTIYRWESGSQRPDPDDIWNIEKIFKAPGLWHKWMLSHYDSYREHYTGVSDTGHLTAEVSRMKFEVEDLQSLFDKMERDTLNGEFNDPELWRVFKKEAPEAIAAIRSTLDRIPKEI